MSQPRIWLPWEKKGEPFVLDVQPSATKAFITPDGRKFQDCEITLSAEDADRMWKGYKCANCLEPFQEAYPEKCIVCGFPVRRLQRQALERQFQGEDPTVVGSFPLDREMEHLDKESHKKVRK